MKKTTTAPKPKPRFITNFADDYLPIYEEAIKHFEGYSIRKSEPSRSGVPLENLHSLWYSGSSYTDVFFDFVFSLKDNLK